MSLYRGDWGSSSSSLPFIARKGIYQTATRVINAAPKSTTPKTTVSPTYNTSGSFVNNTPVTTTQEAPANTSYAPEASAPAYSAPSLEVDLAGIWETAGQMADNEINPQLAEIDRQLQEAGYSAEESQRAINEAYPVARRSLQKSIYENMSAGEQGLAAMGTGRGGGRQELLARAGEKEATGLESIETQKQRESGAISRALSNYQGQLGTQRTSLQGQRGGLQATYAEQIRGNRFNEAATTANIGLQKEQLAEQARQFNSNLAENTRQFDVSRTPLPGTGSSTSTGSSSNYSGLNYFLTDDDLKALGLSTTLNNTASNTTGLTGGVYTPNQIQAGRPEWLKRQQLLNMR